MNKKRFVELIEPFTSPKVETIMGEGLPIIVPEKMRGGRFVKIKHELLFIDNSVLLYSTDDDHYFFKIKNWHDIEVPFNPNMKWGSHLNSSAVIIKIKMPITEKNDGRGWMLQRNYQIIPKNYLSDYFGIGHDFLNWSVSEPWKVKE